MDIPFYLGFFPAFIDLSEVTSLDTGIIIVIAALAVGGPKLVYAVLADRAGVLLINAGVCKSINGVAGLVLLAVGLFLIVRT